MRSLCRLDHTTIPLWLVFTITWLSYASTYLLRKPIGVLKSPYGSSIQLSNTQLGLLDLSLLLPYALVQMLFGQLTDKIGPRITLSVALLGAGLSLLFFKFNQSYSVFLLMLLLSGSFQSFCWSACNTGISQWETDKRKRHDLLGYFGTSPFAGGVAGTLFAVFILKHFGWQNVFFWPSLITITFSVLTYFLFLYPPSSPLTLSHGTRSSQHVFKTPGAISTAMAVFCLKVVRYGLYFWLPLQLERELGYSNTQASNYSVLFDVGAAIGCLIAGKVLAVLFKSNALIGSAVQSVLSAAALVLFILLSRFGPVAVCVCIALVGALNGAPDVILCGIVPADLVNSDKVAAMIGFVNGLGSFGGMIEGPLIGLVADKYGWTGVSLSMIGFSVLAGLFCFLAHYSHQRKREIEDANEELENISV